MDPMIANLSRVMLTVVRRCIEMKEPQVGRLASPEAYLGNKPKYVHRYGDVFTALDFKINETYITTIWPRNPQDEEAQVEEIRKFHLDP